jgi:hypothetical protein
MGRAMAERGISVPSPTDVFDERVQLKGWSVSNYGHGIQIRPSSPLSRMLESFE